MYTPHNVTSQLVGSVGYNRAHDSRENSSENAVKGQILNWVKAKRYKQTSATHPWRHPKKRNTLPATKSSLLYKLHAKVQILPAHPCSLRRTWRSARSCRYPPPGPGPPHPPLHDPDPKKRAPDPIRDSPAIDHHRLSLSRCARS